MENSEGKREPVEALSLIISHREQPEGSVEVAVKAKKFGELTQSSPALWQVPKSTKGKEW